MLDWEFGDPWFLLLLVFAPLAYWLARAPVSLLSYSSLTLVADSRRSGGSGFRGCRPSCWLWRS